MNIKKNKWVTFSFTESLIKIAKQNKKIIVLDADLSDDLGLNKFSDEDLILINDLDEIPNLENFEYKSKITLFRQKMFYYKLNLIYPDFFWTGSKACKKKHLVNKNLFNGKESNSFEYFISF